MTEPEPSANHLEPSPELAALLSRPSVRQTVEHVSACDRWATPFLVRRQAEDVAAIAAHEVSVSAARLCGPDGKQIGSFKADDGAFANTAKLLSAAYGGDRALVLRDGTTGANQILSRYLANNGHHVLLAASAHHSLPYAFARDGVEYGCVGFGYDADFDAPLPPTPDELNSALERHHSSAVLITAPSYEGAWPDFAGLAEVAHRHGALLIVDQAWGAHADFGLGLSSALREGADVIVTSLHKTGGAAQGSATLVWREDRVLSADIRAAHEELDSTSPSVLMWTSIDSAVREMLVSGPAILGRCAALIRHVQDDVARRLPSLPAFHAPAGFRDDPLRISFSLVAHGVDGFQVRDALSERGIAAEKASMATITFIATPQLDDNAPTRLVDALVAIVANSARQLHPLPPLGNPLAGLPETPAVSPQHLPRLARQVAHQVPLDEARGMICAQPVELYPPGILILRPGFLVTSKAIEHILEAQKRGGDVTSTRPWDGTVLAIHPGDLGR